MRANRPRRIGIDARRMPAGGLGRYLREHLARLPTEAPDFRFVVFAHPRDQSAILSLSQKLEIREVRGAPSTPWGHALLWQAVRTAELDLFHAPSMPLPPLLPCRTAVTVHDLSPGRFPASDFQSWRFRKRIESIGKQADLILVVSEAVAQELVIWMDRPADSMRVVPNGVADSFVTGGVADRSEIDVLIGRLGLKLPYAINITNGSAAKGVDLLLSAMRRIQGLQMVLVGEGSDHPRVQAMVAAAQLGPERIKLLGNVSEREMRMLYHRARVAVVASRYEGFGLPAVEAMACGVPLVATKTGGIPEVAGDAAVLIDPDSPAAIAEAVYRVAFEMDDGERESLVRRASARARRFSWQSAVRLTAAAYRHVFAREMSDDSC
jgi:glycosyltransferase involved in cell wall biosynthesis